MQPLSVRAASVVDVSMMARNPPKASPTKPVVGKNAKPLSPGSNYPTTKNIQTQKSGFGTFLQKFQKADGKSKYGMPIFLPNGNINPAYLAAERKAEAAQKKKNMSAAEAKRKSLISKGTFELADYIRKKIGDAGLFRPPGRPLADHYAKTKHKKGVSALEIERAARSKVARVLYLL